MPSRRRRPLRWSTAAAVLLCAGLLTKFAGPSAVGAVAAAQNCFAAAASGAADIDLGNCRAYRNGAEVPTDPAAVLAALGIGTENKFWSGGKVDDKAAAADTFAYVVAFRQATAVGSILAERSPENATRTAYALKASVSGAADPKDKSQWEPVVFPGGQSGMRLATLPPGFKTRAVLIEEVRQRGTSSPGMVRLFAARLHNAMPAANATVPSEHVVKSMFSPAYTLSAENLVKGTGIWQNNGIDDGVVRGPAVTEFDPCWLVAQWDKAQTISGLLVDDNFVKVRFLAYVGPAGFNPVIGNDDEWQRIKLEQQVTARHDKGGLRWVTFDQPVTSRAIKVEILETTPRELQIARVSGMHVYCDLGPSAAVPQVQVVESPPPFKIKYALPRAGMATVAVDGPDGRRVRNLFAREQRPAGANEEPWDLKDENGKPVAPGKYTLKVLSNPGLQLRYQMTPYPNIEVTAPDNSPWLNGERGPGGWLADHTSNTSVCAAGDRVYIGAPCAESGVALIECDLTGKKLWGHHNFLAWTGPTVLAADDAYVYSAIAPNGTEHGDLVYRVRLKDKVEDKVLDLAGDASRKRGLRGAAARGGKLYLSVKADDDAFANAAVAEDVDADHCAPTYPRIDKRKQDNRSTWVPERRNEFPALFRLTPMVPGYRGLVDIETAKANGNRQHVVLAFTKPIPIGSLVFPLNHALPMRISLLKAGVTGAPDPADESQWEQIYAAPKTGEWTVVAAPPNATSRALRISFAKGFDKIEDLLSGDRPGVGGTKDKDPADILNKRDAGDGEKVAGWSGSIEGMKILRRRFESLLPTAKVVVNSGAVNEKGEWDAQRAEPISAEKPGIYAMQWEQPQTVRGLAIKEIDGATTEVDAYTGPESGAIDIGGDANWTKVATYEQERRFYGQPEVQMGPNNMNARYVDGYVDFGKDVRTRAVRLRVVAQWSNTGPAGYGTKGVRKDRGGQEIAANRCRVYGVAPVRLIGGEVPIDPMISQRIEEWDTSAVDPTARDSKDKPRAKLTREVSFEKAGHLAFGPGPAGKLYGISGQQVVEVDMSAGQHRTVVSDLMRPQSLSVDSAGNLYVLDNAPERKVVRAYDAAGKFLRSLGKPGGYVTGAWDPERIDHATAIAVDPSGQLWHTEASYWPKRTVCRDATTGAVKKEFLGNTQYGGGGVLDPQDKRRMYYGPLEFELDWDTGKSRLKNLTWRGSSAPGMLPAYVNGRQYLLTLANFSQQPDGGVGTVYLYDNGVCRAAAAMGPARTYPPFMTAAFQAAYTTAHGNKPLGEQKFVWYDANGNGEIEVDEVQFARMGERFTTNYFDVHDLSLSTSQKSRYEVKKFLPSGVPVYEEKAYPNVPAEPSVRLSDGNSVFMINGDNVQKRSAKFTPDGQELWGYKNDGFGGHALTRASPWAPGKVVSEFDIIGQATAHAGDLGEFFVTNSNVGQWNVYTADGLCAGWLFVEIRNPVRRPWSMPEHQRGLALDDVTAGQEHFQGYFCKTADNHYYCVGGHNHASVVEVIGLDQFKRADLTFEVSAKDLEGLQTYDHAMYKKLAYEKVKVLDAYPRLKPISVDGNGAEWDGQPGGARIDGGGGLAFKMTYDEKYLYVLYDVRGKGPLKNVGNDWRALIRSGASVDLQFGLDPAADPARVVPVKGDGRVLITYVEGRPVAVLYQSVAPDARPGEGHLFKTQVQQAGFDRVVRLERAVVACTSSADGYTLEAATPLADLGLTVTDGLRIKLDWGIAQSGPGGSEVVDRLWWSNKVPTPYDEAAEARLHPDLWGYARFSAKAKGESSGPGATGAARILEGEKKSTKKKKEEIEDELEKGVIK